MDEFAKFHLEKWLVVLDYLTERKGKCINFVKIDDEVRNASFNYILKNNPDLI